MTKHHEHLAKIKAGIGGYIGHLSEAQLIQRTAVYSRLLIEFEAAEIKAALRREEDPE